MKHLDFKLNCPCFFIYLLLIIFNVVVLVKTSDNQKNISNNSSEKCLKTYALRRKYIHTKQELETTNNSPIINAQPCGDAQPISIFIPSAAQVSGKYFDRRQSVRKTWVNEAKTEYNISVYFVLGLNQNNCSNELIRKESEQFNDIIQFDFIDNYYNLTLKMISILNWVQNNCQSSQYILKADDDVIINIRRLLEKLSSFKPGITGYKVTERRNTDKCHRSYLPDEYYGKEWLPDYVWGGSYLMTSDVVNKLVQFRENYHGYYLDNEDVFLTGILAQAAGVPRYLSREFDFIFNCRKINLCKMFSIIALVQCESAHQLVDFYRSWKNISKLCCSNSNLCKTSLLILLMSFVIFIYHFNGY